MGGFRLAEPALRAARLRRARGNELALAALPFALLAVGCATYGSHLTATPIAPGESELTLAADGLLIDRGFGLQPLPNPDASLRWGLADGLDLGLRAHFVGLESTARVRLVRSGAFSLAAVPGLGFAFVPVTNEDTGLFNANLLGGLLAGLGLGGGDELVLGARAIATYAFPLTAFRGDASGDKMLYRVGGVVGVRVRLSDSLSLFPDLNVFAPYDSERKDWTLPILQGGVALSFD